MKDVEELSDDWECPDCGNDKLNSEWPENYTNIQIFQCSECEKKVAKRIW